MYFFLSIKYDDIEFILAKKKNRLHLHLHSNKMKFSRKTFSKIIIFLLLLKEKINVSLQSETSYPSIECHILAFTL